MHRIMSSEYSWVVLFGLVLGVGISDRCVVTLLYTACLAAANILCLLGFLMMFETIRPMGVVDKRGVSCD